MRKSLCDIQSWRVLHIDGRALRHPGYAIRQCCRKRIEEVFGWIKTTGGLAQLKVRGLAKVQAVFTFAILAYNLVRIPKLLHGCPVKKFSSRYKCLQQLKFTVFVGTLDSGLRT